MTDRGDGPPEPEPVPRRDIALGDRDEARQARLRGEQVVAARIELALRHPVTDRKEPALAVEEEAEVHRPGHGPRRRLERREAPLERAGRVFAPGEVAAVALDRALRGLRPVQHFGAGRVAALAGQRSRDIDHRLGLGPDITGALAERGAQRIERPVQLVPGDRLRAPVLGKHAQGFAREIQRVPDAGESFGTGHRGPGPFPARIGQREEVAGQVAAVHRRDVLRVQRPQVPRVVPVVEVAAKPRQVAHRLERGFQPRDGVERARPAEIAGADRGKQIEADDWWARCDARRPASGLPGNCPAAACGPLPSRRSRRSARCGARPAAERARPPPKPASAPATSGDRLAHRAMAGDAIQASTNGNATGQASLPIHPTTTAAATARTTPPLMCR